jgi:large subunit ribosomal protein L11
VEEIARLKLPDINSTDLSKAIKIIEGTARSMGIVIEG